MKAFKEWLNKGKFICRSFFPNYNCDMVKETWRAALKWTKKELESCLCEDEIYDTGLNELKEIINEELKED